MVRFAIAAFLVLLSGVTLAEQPASEAGLTRAFGGIALLARVRDGEALSASLRKLVANQGFSVEESDGLFAVDFAPGGEQPAPRLFWGVRQGTLVLGIDPARVRGALDGWPEGQRLRDGEDFARVFEHLAASPRSLSYLNLPRVRQMVEESQFLRAMIAADPEKQAAYDLILGWVDTGMGIGTTTQKIGDGSLQMTYGPDWFAGSTASLGIIAAIAVPNFLNAVDRGKQKRTMADMRSLGTGAEEFAIDNNRYPVAKSIDELVPQIEPVYIRVAPTVDGWGNAFLVVSTAEGYVIASPGKDGQFEADWSTATGQGPTVNFDDDIVFRNGQFEQWPEGTQQ